MKQQEEPWAPFTPAKTDRWDLRKAAHLHRRAGFGATWAELERDMRDGMETSVNRLMTPREPSEQERTLLDTLRQGATDVQRLKSWWLHRILYGFDPLREKLTLFWHGHFATSIRKVGSIAHMLRQNETFRRHAIGEFAPLLTDMVSDPAMLIWLDGITNRRGAVNENFGREFLELFTLGVGRYTEADVLAAARSFTGWIDATGRVGEGPAFRHDHNQFDDGEKTFLGRRGRWGAADIIRITLEQPVAAEFLCRKLYAFFVSETAQPPATYLRHLAEQLRSSNYSIRRVVGIILRSRHFYAESVIRQRVKGPVEFTAALLRALDVPRGSVPMLAVAASCDRQGQALFSPPNVKGWDGGRSWLNSSAVLERSNWIADVVWGNPDFGVAPFEPLAWAERNRIPRDRIATTFIDLLLQGNLSQRARTLIMDAGRDGTADALRRALQLTLHYPAYQLA